jgi:hypothetical protein
VYGDKSLTSSFLEKPMHLFRRNTAKKSKDPYGNRLSQVISGFLIMSIYWIVLGMAGYLLIPSQTPKTDDTDQTSPSGIQSSNSASSAPKLDLSPPPAQMP